MLIGVVIFVVASVLCAVAEGGGVLIAGRALQGLGGSMILPTTLALLNANFQGRERGIAFAVWGSTIGGMAAVGPLLGGWLTENASCRWAFGINVPLGALIVAGLLRRLDVNGALLSILGFGALLAIGTLALLIRPDSSAWLTSPILLVYGMGVGLATAQLTSVVLSEVPVARSGAASGHHTQEHRAQDGD